VNYNTFSRVFWIIFQWRNVIWYEVISLNFYNYFSMEKCDMAWGDVTCFLNFQNYFSIEKGDMAWGDFLEFVELFSHGEKWYGMMLFFWIFISIFQWRKMMWHKMMWQVPWIFRNIFQWRKMTWHKMMWHTCMLRELKLMTCSGS
jgi:hypothetical protein